MTNVAWLREVDEGALARGAHLFQPSPGDLRRDEAWGNYERYGDRHIVTPNEPEGVVLTYHLGTEASPAPRLRIADLEGNDVRSIDGPGRAGLHTVVWELSDDGKRLVKPGAYRVTLEAAGQSITKPVQVLEPGAVVP